MSQQRCCWDACRVSMRLLRWFSHLILHLKDFAVGRHICNVSSHLTSTLLLALMSLCLYVCMLVGRCFVSSLYCNVLRCPKCWFKNAIKSGILHDRFDSRLISSYFLVILYSTFQKGLKSLPVRCGNQRHLGLCLGYVPALALGSCKVPDHGTTRWWPR